jgi:Flp pilus assembly protein TadG
MLLNARHAVRGGGIAPLVAFLLIVLLGVTAIALEGGNLVEQRRRTQAAADTAAMSAAADLYANYAANAGLDATGSATTSALNNAKTDGYKNDATSANAAGTSTVNVVFSPSMYTGGPNIGTPLPPGYVEVTITTYVARYFSQIWGTNTLPVTARAVARGQWIPSAQGIIALNPTKSPSINTVGLGTITVNGNAPVIANSNGTPAVNGTISASRIYAVGTSTVSGVPYTKLTGPVPDPLAYIPEPSTTASTAALGKGLPTDPPPIGSTTVNGISYTTYGPGMYTAPPSAGKNTGVLFQADPNNPEYGPIVMIESGWGTMSQGTVMSNGVVIFADYNANGNGSHFSGQSNVNLTGPSSGPYAGIAFFQDRQDTGTLLITGQGNVQINGAYYAASSVMSTRGLGDMTVNGQMILDSFNDRGNGSLVVNFSSAEVGKARLIQLVE